MDNSRLSEIIDQYSFSWQKFKKDYNAFGNICVEGIKDAQRGWMVSNLLMSKKVLMVCDDYILAKRLSMELDDWNVKNVLLPCSWSHIDHKGLDDISGKLNGILYRKKGVMVLSTEEWSQGWSYRYTGLMEVIQGEQFEYGLWMKKMMELGYTRTKKISSEGEYSILGENWIIWARGKKYPYRVTLENNRVKSIEVFYLIGGNQSEYIKKISIRGTLERVESGKGMSDFVDKYFDAEVIVFESIFDHNIKLDIDNYFKDKRKVKKIFLGELMSSDCSKKIRWPINGYGLMEIGLKGVESINKVHKIERNIIVTRYPKQFRKMVNESRVDISNQEIIIGRIPEGWMIKDDKIAVWSDKELFGKMHVKDRKKDIKKVSFKKLSEYKVGDLVVHSDHGVGMLKDFTQREVFAGVKKDYLVVAYSHGDLLYVPVEQMNKISKYIGSKLIKLNRLGSNVWAKRRKKVQKQIEMMAKELLRLYAARKLVARKPYTVSQTIIDKLDDDFQFELTTDQTIALEDIMNDLGQPYPMDRLLCGDVGFGKTELAIRAAARAAANNKQVALMSPTTILAEQHFATLLTRLSVAGIRVDVISRLRDKHYQKSVLERLKNGSIDVLVGTHRLLQRDVVFKDLGLLIIDEEQKFGVRAKEQLKKIRKEVDILSMSATPIPRTLNISMGGVRDLSILEIPPIGRRSIHTEVLPYNDNLIVEAVRREKARGGQVFIVHNRVRTIEQYKSHLETMLEKNTRIGVAHGKMIEKDLALTMNGFAKGDFDVLLATTIVENGLDLPNVNTLIVENAAGLGLSQLYQLRGRVGRSSRKAFAYFLYRSDKLKAKAKQRLEALSEARELGSGMKLAVADMEIRGVGNILGVQQHGNAYSVGLGMFLDMLEDMVEKLKGNRDETEVKDDQVLVDLPVSFAIPSYYIENKDERLFWEQKLAVQSKIEDVDKIVKDMVNRYGVLPDICQKLIKIVKIRMMAQEMGIEAITTKKKMTLSGYEENNLILKYRKQIDVGWIKYLFSLDGGWIFGDKESIIDLNKLERNDWFEWLFEVLGNRLISE